MKLSVFLVSMALCSVAVANPRPLPFSYQHEQLAEGEAELEQFVDLNPVRARSDSTGEPVWYGQTQFTTELEYGISSRLELGLYAVIVPGAASGFASIPRASESNGMKQRLRYQLAPTGVWPLDVGLYGEVAENEREIELEAKIILQRRIGPLRLIANASAEQEIYYDGTRDLVLSPSAGATVEITPAVQPGIEWWMHAEYPEEDPPDPRPFTLGPHHYVGPALLLQFGKVWWTSGVYLRVNETRRTLQPGEGFGALWARSVVGIGL
ncbi:MAG: hypothetical protein KC776_16830 [Myxococcales bacterium]|nr:hypothetical protein [Myxococcales bacterium]MCB9575524.1 hypothetical protein [Polyangiaceae bacterium]